MIFVIDHISTMLNFYYGKQLIEIGFSGEMNLKGLTGTSLNWNKKYKTDHVIGKVQIQLNQNTIIEDKEHDVLHPRAK